MATKDEGIYGVEGPGPEKPVTLLPLKEYVGPILMLRGEAAVVATALGHDPEKKVCAQFSSIQLDVRRLDSGWWLFDRSDWK